MSGAIVVSDQTIVAEGAVVGGVRVLLRLEGLAVLTAASLAYATTGTSWLVFSLAFFAPDLSFAAYLAGPRIGAAAYNAAHSIILPLLLAVCGYLFKSDPAFATALIWLAHIGFDRLLGYGLKYQTAFRHTHLGLIGRDPVTTE
jgi:hypothetical protein